MAQHYTQTDEKGTSRMELSRFVQQLQACAPTVEDLECAGLSYEEASNFRRNYYLKERATGYSGSDPLLGLINTYDASGLEIGGICFAANIVETERCWLVGTQDFDLLVIDRVSGEVRIEDANGSGRVLWHCAENSSKFLQALLPVACFLGQCAYDSQLYNDQRKKETQAQDCAVVAGGTTYLPFFHSLIGVD